MKIIFYIVCVLHSALRADTASVHFYGKMYRTPEETSALITMLEDRCKITVLSEKGSWLEVQAKGYRGWILKSQTSWNKTGEPGSRILPEGGSDPDKKTGVLNLNVKNISIAGSVLLILVFSLILIYNKRKIAAKLKTDISRNTQVLKINHQDQSKHHAIIISNKDKNVKSSISNVHKKLSTCFREIGFNVGFVDSLKIHVIETDYVPDIIAVDFEISPKVIKKTEKILLKSGFNDDVPVFFFNIPEPEKVEPSRLLKRTFYIGQTFTDQDLLKIAGAAIETFRQDGNTKGLLEGHITGDGIFEIFQLLEIGRKSGHLKIYSTDNKPVGIVGFNNGLISYAKTVKSQAHNAVHELLALRNGKFEFIAKALRHVNCNLVPTAVMMQSVKIEDEMAAGIHY